MRLVGQGPTDYCNPSGANAKENKRRSYSLQEVSDRALQALIEEACSAGAPKIEKRQQEATAYQGCFHRVMQGATRLLEKDAWEPRSCSKCASSDIIPYLWQYRTQILIWDFCLEGCMEPFSCLEC
eukprot:4120807-Karenia_brevis.AAC.1